MAERAPSAGVLFAELVRGHEMRCGCDLRVAGVAIRVDSNSPELVAALRDYLHVWTIDGADTTQVGAAPDVHVLAIEAEPARPDLPFLPVAVSTGRRVKEEYAELLDGRVVRKRLTGILLLLGQGPQLVIGPCRQNLNQVVNFINNRYIQWHLERGWLLCHAAGVARQGRGLLLAGFSGRGKSTLALRLIEHGLDFISNDRLLVGGSGELRGLAKWPRVNPGTLLHHPRLLHTLSKDEVERLRAMPPEALWTLEQKSDVDVARVFGPQHVALSAEFAGSVLLSWDRKAGATQIQRVDLAQRPDLLQAVMKQPGILFYDPARRCQANEQAYLDALARVPTHECSGHVDWDAAAAACLRLLGEAG